MSNSRHKYLINFYKNFIKDPIIFIDVGSDGGVDPDLKNIASQCVVHAIEPREDSYNNLINDTRMVAPYQSIYYHNTGLADKNGGHTLYVTNIPQASSLLEPNETLVNRWRGDDGFKVIKKSKIKCITLSEFCNTSNINYIDFIKLDTQGSELSILLHNPSLLSNLSVIKSEIEFVQLYKNQPVFDDVIRELSKYGFRYVGHLDIKKIGPNKGKNIWADVIFVQTKFKSSQSCIRAAIILSQLGFIEDAVWLMEDYQVEEAIIDNFREAIILDNGLLNSALLRLRNKYRDFNQKRILNGKKVLYLNSIRKIIMKSSSIARFFSVISSGKSKRY